MVLAILFHTEREFCSLKLFCAGLFVIVYFGGLTYSVLWYGITLLLLDLTAISYKGITDVKRWAQPSMGGSKPQQQPTDCSNEHHVTQMCIP